MKKVLYLFMVLSLCIGCQKKRTYDNKMAFEDKIHVDIDLTSYELNNKKELNIDIIGVKNFRIFDSLLVFSTVNEDGLWSFYSLKNNTHLGDFLSKGQGPFQFATPPSVGNNVQFTKENDTVLAYIYDSPKGQLVKFNISKSIDNQDQILSIANENMPRSLFNFVMIDSLMFFCKEVSPDLTKQVRFLINEDEKSSLEFLTKLNNAAIKQGEDINILSTITKFSPIENKLVEMPIGLNYVNLYSIDGTFTKTICVDENLYDIDAIQKKNRWRRKYTFADLRLFDSFFGVLKIDEEEKIYQTKRTKLPSILLFDWEGKALAELKLDHHITSFDIDFINNELYTFDVHSDELFKYNIEHLQLSSITTKDSIN